MMPIIYICSPYSGDIEGNTVRARKYSRYVLDRGGVPIAPHLLFPQFVSEDTEREIAMRADLEILERCDAVYVFGLYYSTGMLREIAHAKNLGIEIIYIKELES